MSRDDLKRLSHRLSSILRHQPEGLPMDAAGWVPIDALLARVGVPREALDAVVAENNKSRFTVRGDQVRACQGHSLASTPVTREGLEASWSEDLEHELLWHGTSLAALEPIAREGILPGERSHVHLAAATDSAVGKRAGVDALLAVDTKRLREKGFRVFVSENGVRLAREVPPGCIAGVAPGTRRAEAELPPLAARLGLPLRGARA
ncbi:MAG: RNA 2'-phosphotransferase [Polyangiales bacterium]